MATHEDVKEFNREINSVLATAPPISRAKMAAITKSALKAQSHKEKDVFGPRFARNLPTTFTHIFKCKSEDIVSTPNTCCGDYSLELYFTRLYAL
jgi:hypothetical protein